MFDQNQKSGIVINENSDNGNNDSLVSEVQFEHGPYETYPSTTRRKKLIMIGSIVLILIIAGAGTYAYLRFFAASPENVVRKMERNLKNVKTLDLSFALDSDNSFEWKVDLNDQNNLKYDISYDMNYYTGAIRIVNDIIYSKLSFKSDADRALMGGADAGDSPIIEKWIKYDPNDKSVNYMPGMAKQLSSGKEKSIRSIIYQPGILSVANKLADGKIGGADCYHYGFLMDRGKFTDIANEVNSMMKMNPVFEYSASAVYDDILRAQDKSDNVAGEIWIGKSDFLPHQIVFNKKISPKQEQAPNEIEIHKPEPMPTLEIKFADYSKPFQIDVPESSKTISDIEKETLGQREVYLPDEQSLDSGVASASEIQSTMAFVTSELQGCVNSKNEALSGSSGDQMCSESGYAVWPGIKACGTEKSDTGWVVFNGNNDKWDVTVSCKNITDCNGPKNAICNSEGCKFMGTCELSSSALAL